MTKLSKILLVDDEAHVRKYISLLIKSAFPEGIELLQASNADEAVSQFQDVNPDLVLLDINMPGLDGLATLALLLEHDSKATVVMLTSVSSRSSVEKAVDLGASGYLLKDTPGSEIKKALVDLCSELFE